MMDTRYWDGWWNKLVRYYFYVNRGLQLFNEARYLIMSIFAIYFATKLDNIWLIPLMFVVSLPVLVFFGWLFVHKMAKITDFLNVEFSTHWSKYGYELQENIISELKEVNLKLGGEYGRRNGTLSRGEIKSRTKEEGTGETTTSA
jgi:hypothetical protein